MLALTSCLAHAGCSGHSAASKIAIGSSAYPPGSHAGIVILRLADHSAATVSKAIGDLASLAEPENLTEAVAVQRGLLRIRHP